MDGLVAAFGNLSPFAQGLAGSFIAGLGTGVGALPVFFLRRLGARSQDLLLGFSAGIMLAASFFSLILPGLGAAALLGAAFNPALVVASGVLLGAFGLWWVHGHVPHEHLLLGREGPADARVGRMLLIVLAITLHNFPEGLAVGVGFGAPGLSNAIGLMTGIGVQNMPEGLVVAIALVAAGRSRVRAFVVALFTGLVEPVGGLAGAAAVELAGALLPWALGTAAGAMLFVISNEIIPETHRRGHQAPVSFALLGGFGFMMTLDQMLR
jgi:ZIP family zinc transporter